MTTGVLGAILAAGASTRLGRPKALVRVDGETLIERSVRFLTEATGEAPLVVLGHEPRPIVDALNRSHAMLAINTDWRSGIAGSIALAARTVPVSAAGLLVTVCDMPWLTVSHYQRLLASFMATPDDPSAAGYPGGAGVPAVFPPTWFGRLRALSGDTGARHLLGESGVRIALDLGDDALDIDTPDDLDALTKSAAPPT